MGFIRCSDCDVPLVERLPERAAPSGPTDAYREADGCDLDAVISTSLQNPIATTLAESLLQEAGIPYFVVDTNQVTRQEGGNLLGWWNVRVPRARAAEAREILESVEAIK
jgi:Trk K+ transport system NAD-binding subunit